MLESESFSFLKGEQAKEIIVHSERNIFGRASTLEQVGKESATEGQCNEAV